MTPRISRRALLRAGAATLAVVLLPSARVSGAAEALVRLRSEDNGRHVRFQPCGLLIRPDTTVTWVIESGVHTVTAYHPANGSPYHGLPAGTTPWDSGYLLEPGAVFRQVFTREGVYDYFCRPHEAAGMVGRIVVAAGSAALAEPDTSGLQPAVREHLPPVRVITRRRVVERWPEST
jgi:plastocyanin